METIKDKIYLYFCDEKYYIFKNCLDAWLGLLVLIVIPSISIILAFNQSINFFNFYFPIISICLAEIYDAYGRKDGNDKKGTILNIRIVLALFSLMNLILVFFIEKYYWLPSLILILNALLIVVEIFLRIKLNIKTNKYYGYISIILENKIHKKEVEDEDDVI